MARCVHCKRGAALGRYEMELDFQDGAKGCVRIVSVANVE